MSAAKLLKRHQKGVERDSVIRKGKRRREREKESSLVTCTGVLVAALPFATKQAPKNCS